MKIETWTWQKLRWQYLPKNAILSISSIINLWHVSKLHFIRTHKLGHTQANSCIYPCSAIDAILRMGFGIFHLFGAIHKLCGGGAGDGYVALILSNRYALSRFIRRVPEGCNKCRKMAGNEIQCRWNFWRHHSSTGVQTISRIGQLNA